MQLPQAVSVLWLLHDVPHGPVPGESPSVSWLHAGRGWSCTPCLSGAGVPSNETGACRQRGELRGDLLGKPGRRNAGVPSTPSHSWHALLGHVFNQRSSWPSCLSLISAENVCLGRVLKKSKHVVLLPQNILLYICSLQVWDFGSTFN